MRENPNGHRIAIVSDSHRLKALTHLNTTRKEEKERRRKARGRQEEEEQGRKRRGRGELSILYFL
jgi:hypothetical protein